MLDLISIPTSTTDTHKHTDLSSTQHTPHIHHTGTYHTHTQHIPYTTHHVHTHTVYIPYTQVYSTHIHVYHVYTTGYIYYVCTNTHITHIYHAHRTHAHTAPNATHSHTSIHYARAVVSIKPKLGKHVITFHHRPCQHCNNQFHLCLIIAFVDSRFPLHPWYPVISVHGNIAKSLCTQLVPQFLWRAGLIHSDFVENDTAPHRGIKDKLPFFWKSFQFCCSVSQMLYTVT